MAMINCPQCKSEISEHAVKCPHCGEAVRETLAAEQTKRRCESLRQKADASLERGEYADALATLRELAVHAGESSALDDEITRLEEMLRTRDVEAAVKRAEEMSASGQYLQAVAECDRAITMSPQHSAAQQIRSDASAQLKAVQTRSRSLFIVGVLGFCTIAVAGTGVGIREFNKSHIKKARGMLASGDHRRAEAELDGCILGATSDMLAPGRAELYRQIARSQSDSVHCNQLRRQLEERLNSVQNRDELEKLSSLVWKEVLASKEKAHRSGDDVQAVESACGSASRLLQLAEAESRCERAAGVARNDHAADKYGRSWKPAMQLKTSAAAAFLGGRHGEAYDLWEQAAARFEESAKEADVARKEEASRKEAEAKRREAERQREREAAAERRLAECKQRAEKLAASLRGPARNCRAFAEAAEAANEGHWERAADKYEMARRFRFTQSFDGALSLLNKWKLDGSTSQEHRIAERLSDDDQVLLLVNSTSSSSISFFLKSPRGEEMSIDDEDVKRIDTPGNWSVGARGGAGELRVAKKYTYSFTLEVYRGD